MILYFPGADIPQTGSRRRRGCDVNIPRTGSRRRRGRDVDIPWRLAETWISVETGARSQVLVSSRESSAPLLSSRDGSSTATTPRRPATARRRKKKTRVARPASERPEPPDESQFGLGAAEAFIQGALEAPRRTSAERPWARGAGVAAARRLERPNSAPSQRLRSPGKPFHAFGKSVPSVGTKTSDLTAADVRRLENGLVEPVAQRRALKKLNAFFGGALDKYECSWPHTPGARVCEGIFEDQIHQHHVRRGLGGERVSLAADEAAAGQTAPAGMVDTARIRRLWHERATPRSRARRVRRAS